MDMKKSMVKVLTVAVVSVALAITSFASENNGNATTTTIFESKLEQFQATYPNGSYWTTNREKNGTGEKYKESWECAGFAKLLVDLTFGFKESDNWNVYYPQIADKNVNNISLGDYVRLNGTLNGAYQNHSIFVRGIDADYIYAYECLGGSNNVIRIATKYKKSEVQAALNDSRSSIRRALPEYYNAVFGQNVINDGGNDRTLPDPDYVDQSFKFEWTKSNPYHSNGSRTKGEDSGVYFKVKNSTLPGKGFHVRAVYSDGTTSNWFHINDYKSYVINHGVSGKAGLSVYLETYYSPEYGYNWGNVTILWSPDYTPDGSTELY